MRQTEPTIITTREALEWERSFCDYPATLWNLQYRFRGPGPGFNAAGVADGTSFVITVPAADTTTMTAGKYAWQAWLTEKADASNTFEFETGTVDVRLGFDPGSIAAVDTRSAAQIALDVIDAALSGQMTANVLEYEISTNAGTRKVKRMSSVDLIEARKYYRKLVASELARERARKGLGFGRRINVVMYD